MADYLRPASIPGDLRRIWRRLAGLERRVHNLNAWANEWADERVSEWVDEELTPGEWQAPTLLNSWSNTGGGAAPAGYYIDSFGRVYLRGLLAVPGSSPVVSNAFVLAAGFRPAYEHSFTAVSGSAGGTPVWATVTVYPSGTVEIAQQLCENVPLDDVQFRTL